VIWADGYCRFPQVRFGRVFAPLTRKVPQDAAMVTAYTDGSVTLRSNRRRDGYHEARDMSGHQGVEPGDLVVHGLDILRGSVGVSDSRGAISSVCTVCAPKMVVDARYVAYVIRAQAFTGLPRAMARGVREGGADFRRWDTLAELPLPLPPASTQRSIADYLDRETRRIDGLVAARRHIVELLDERQASWLHQTLASLGSTSRTVPLKSVARWVEGPGIMTVDFRDEGMPLLRIRNLVGDTVDLTGCGHVSASLARERWNHLRVHTGELLVSGSARSGTPVVVPPEADGAVPYTGLIRMWPTNGNLTRDYLRLFLVSPMFDRQIDRLKTGVGLQHWGPYHLAQIGMPLPSVEEQIAVSAEFAYREQRHRELSRLHSHQIALLRERRQALITATVTGQLDIPERP
jgi:type I restriction enzyme, S subunit